MRTVLKSTLILMLLAPGSVSLAQQGSSVPAGVKEFWSHLIGTWDVKGKVGPSPVEGIARFEWAEGKHCYIGQQSWTFDDGRTIELAQLAGWDAVEKATIEQGFGASGEAARVSYKPPSAKEVMEGSIRGADRAGAPWTGDVKLEVISPGEFRLTSTVDGDTVHALTYVRQTQRAHDD